jgi:signal transduction histidine kinase
VALALTLKLARMKVEGSSEAATLLDAAGAELQASLAELRELARGIHPAILTDHGLADRVGALDGWIVVESPPGEGTTLRAEIPC